MSDQTGPGQPPQPPAPPAYGAPAYPPPPAYGAPPFAPQPPAPKKKSRAWVWVLVTFLLLLCCGGAAAAGLIAYGVNTAQQQADTIKAADAAYMKAVKRLQSSAASAAVLQGPEGVAKATPELDAAAQDLADSRAAIEKLPDSEGRKTYLAGLDRGDAAVTTLRSILAEASGKSQFLDTAKAGIALYNSGAALLNSAVDLANKNRYASSSGQAGQAKAQFQQARAKFVEAEKVDPSADMGNSITYVDLQLRKCDYALQMNGYGAKRQTAAYNRIVPKFNALNKQIAGIRQPEALSDPNWATKLLTNLQAKFAEQLNASGELVTKAHTLYGAN